MKRSQGSSSHRPLAAQGRAPLPAPLPPSSPRSAPTSAASGTALLQPLPALHGPADVSLLGLPAKIKPLSGGSEPMLRLGGALCLCFLHSLPSPR